VSDRLDILAGRLRALDRRGPAAPIVLTASSSPSSPPESPILTLAQAAEIVHLHPRTVRRWPAPWIVLPGGRAIRIRRTDFERFLTERIAGQASAFPPPQK
jgi:hypothetical protein